MRGSAPGYLIRPQKAWLVEVEARMPQWISSRP